MARPLKAGMDYFPHDTDASNDEKIEAIRALHGNDGYAFYFILCERIYRTPDAELDISKKAVEASLINKIGITLEKFKEILQTAFEVELFCREAYEERQVLTSKGIKKRAGEVQALRERWRKQKEFHTENPAENREENEDPDPSFPFAKEKKRKEKKNKNKEKDLSLTTAQSAPDESPTNKDLIAELTENYREIDGVEPSKGDFAFIGALYNEYGYQEVLMALNKLKMVLATQPLEKPLLYLKGILKGNGQTRDAPKNKRLPRGFQSILDA